MFDFNAYGMEDPFKQNPSPFEPFPDDRKTYIENTFDLDFNQQAELDKTFEANRLAWEKEQNKIFENTLGAMGRTADSFGSVVSGINAIQHI